jgi:hypothetical protein
MRKLKLTTELRVAQIVGSMAISGHRVSDELRDQMTRIINGEVTADEVRREILLRYRKPDIS